MNLTGRPIYQKQGKPAKKRTGLNPVSAKRAAYRRSPEGKAASLYMSLVKTLPCAVCRAPAPSDAHHCIHDRYGSAKASDYDTIPLCKDHHQHGPEAIHNGKETWAAWHGSDHSYIPQTRDVIRRMVASETWAEFQKEMNNDD